MLSVEWSDWVRFGPMGVRLGPIWSDGGPIGSDGVVSHTVIFTYQETVPLVQLPLYTQIVIAINYCFAIFD